MGQDKFRRPCATSSDPHATNKSGPDPVIRAFDFAHGAYVETVKCQCRMSAIAEAGVRSRLHSIPAPFSTVVFAIATYLLLCHQLILSQSTPAANPEFNRGVSAMREGNLDEAKA